MFLELRKLHRNGAIRGYQLGTVMILLFMAVRFVLIFIFLYRLSHFFSAILFIL